MKTRPLALLAALTLALTLVPVAHPGPAGAATGWLPPATLLGNHATQQQAPLLAVAPGGRTVVGHVTQATEGAVEVQVKTPGGRFGAVHTLQPAALGVNPSTLRLAAGPDGTLAAVWWSGGGSLVSFLPPGRTSWTSPRTVAGGWSVWTEPVLDGLGRLWVGYVATVSGASVLRVQSLTSSGGPRTTSLRAPAGQNWWEQGIGLAVVTGGVARVVAVRRRLEFVDPTSGPCALVSEVVAADLVRGRTSAVRVRRIASYRATGASSGTSCPAFDGVDPNQPHLVATPTGTTAVYSVVRRDGSQRGTMVALNRTYRATRWSGPSLASRTSPYPQSHLLSVGRRLVAVGYNSAGVPTQSAILVRAPNGRWGTWRPLGGSFGATPAAAAGNNRGAVFGWREQDDDHDLQLRRLSASGVLGPIVDRPGRPEEWVTGAGIDGQGNEQVVFSQYDGVILRVGSLTFDAAGPRLAVRVPRVVVAGRAFRASVTALDAWSPPVTTPVWHFAGGATRTGRSVSHVFPTPGRYQVVVRSADARGLSTAVSRFVVVRRP